jgi:hypothetical protein
MGLIQEQGGRQGMEILACLIRGQHPRIATEFGHDPEFNLRVVRDDQERSRWGDKALTKGCSPGNLLHIRVTTGKASGGRSQLPVGGVESPRRRMHVAGERLGKRQGFPDPSVLQHGLDDREGRGQWYEGSAGGARDGDSQVLQGLEQLRRTVEVDRVSCHSKEWRGLRLPCRRQQSGEGRCGLSGLRLELPPERAQVHLIDPHTMRFHLSDRRYTAPLQRRGLRQPGSLQRREEHLAQPQQDRRIRRRILELVRRQGPTPIAALRCFHEYLMQEPVHQVRETPRPRLQAGIEELRSQHRIHQQALDWQTRLPEKLQIELGVVEDFDGGGLCQHTL